MFITRKILNKYFLQMLHFNNHNGERCFENVLKKQVFDASFQKYIYIICQQTCFSNSIKELCT